MHDDYSLTPVSIQICPLDNTIHKYKIVKITVMLLLWVSVVVCKKILYKCCPLVEQPQVVSSIERPEWQVSSKSKIDLWFIKILKTFRCRRNIQPMQTIGT